MEEIQGLTESEARERRERGLGNDIEVRTGRTYQDFARANLFTTYNNILFVIGVALVALGRYYDAATSVGIGLANALIGTAQEVRAFTVASGSSARHLQLAIRASGDETRRLYDVLQPGVTAVVAGPHGRFDYRRGGTRQVWIAAGIGVTPFMSWIRSLDSSFDREVDFFYAVPNEHDAPFLEEIQEAAVQLPSLRVHLVLSEREGHLTPEKVAKVVQTPLDQVWIFMCGPAQMMRSFERRFRQLGVPRSRIFWKHFELR